MSRHFALCALLTTLCLLLGGATRHGFLGDTLLQIAALPLLVSTGLELAHRGAPLPLSRSVRVLGAAIVAIPLLQLVPLPPALWANLPGRGLEKEAFELVGQPLPWMPLSVSPHATWQSLLSLLAPLTLFGGTVLLSSNERRRLSAVVLAIGFIAIFLGLLQVAQGEGSALRFYEITNRSEAVGFFANRNHFATQLLVLLMLVAAWTADRVHPAYGQPEYRPAPPALRFRNAPVLILIAAFTLLVMIIAGEAMARSRAGLFLTIAGVAAAFLIAAADKRNAFSIKPARLMLAAVCVGVLFAVQFALYRIMERFAVDPLGDARVTFARITFAAARVYLPFGSGMGTFVPVYASIEKPDDALTGIYVNHAHNDFLELFLEAGIPGALALAGFCIWLFRRTGALWRLDPQPGFELDLHLARACAIAVLLILAHSFVDYPLRTTGMTAMLAFSCALVATGAQKTMRRGASAATSQQSGDVEKMAIAARSAQASHPAAAPGTPWQVEPVQSRPAHRDLPIQAPGQARVPLQATQWGAAIQWPESWRKSESPAPQDPLKKPGEAAG